MTIELMKEWHVVVSEVSSGYQWFIYEDGTLGYTGDVYSTYSEAKGKGSYWLRTEIGEGRR